MKQKTAPIEGGLCEKGQESIIKKLISNGNRTEWSPIRSVTIRVITKSDDRAAESDLFITSMITEQVVLVNIACPRESCVIISPSYLFTVSRPSLISNVETNGIDMINICCEIERELSKVA